MPLQRVATDTHFRSGCSIRHAGASIVAARVQLFIGVTLLLVVSGTQRAVQHYFDTGGATDDVGQPTAATTRQPTGNRPTDNTTGSMAAAVAARSGGGGGGGGGGAAAVAARGGAGSSGRVGTAPGYGGGTGTGGGLGGRSGTGRPYTSTVDRCVAAGAHCVVALLCS